MCGNDSVAADTNESECCPLPFGLLRNTSGSGNIVSTHPSALLCSFAYAHHADGFPFFQASPPISPVSGAVPEANSGLALTPSAHHYGVVLRKLLPAAKEFTSTL